MGLIHPPNPVKLICGILAGSREQLAAAAELLQAEFGAIDFQSAAWPFHFTDYYTAEMGGGLIRNFVAFDGRREQDCLPDAKHATNRLELALCERYGRPGDRRPVNLDPGYVSLPKLVLASTKDHSHRVYVGRGVYAEVTLRYHQHRWQAWPWTYPDYGSGTYDPFLTAVRERLHEEIRARAEP